MLTDDEKKKAEEAAKLAVPDHARAIGELQDSMKAIGTQITALATRFEEKLKADTTPAGRTLADGMKLMRESVAALLADDKVTPEDKNKQLQDMAVQLQDSFSKYTKTPVDPKAVAALDSMKAATKSTQILADAMKTMLADNDRSTAVSARTEKFNALIDSVGGDGFSDDDKKGLRLKLADKIAVCETDAAVEKLVTDSLELLNMGRAKEKLVALGYKGKSNTDSQGDRPMIDSSGDRGHLQYVHFMLDKMHASGEWNSNLDHARGTLKDGKPIPTALKNVMDRWDQRNGSSLRKECQAALAMGNGRLTDATLHADFETPYSLARMVLFEAYADSIILGITNFGTMDVDRDVVPITRWRRQSTGNKTFRPTMKERSELQVGEFGSIPEGKLTTEFFPIDAKARKLRAVLSDEFMTRAKRRPDITGVAMAAKNLVDDVQRSLAMDIFYKLLRAALLTDAITFASAQNGDGIASTFQVTHNTTQSGAITINAATAVTIVPESLVIEIGTAVIPEFGTSAVGGGPGAAFFYTVDHALGKVTFVDANGIASPPPSGTGNVKANGKKAGGLSAGRFDLTPSGGVLQDDWMNRLLFKIQDLGAAIPANTGYVPNMVVQSRIVATSCRQAKAFTPLHARNGFTDGKVKDGNFGQFADMSHWASSVFPNNFTIVGLSEACLYRVFEPMILKGPMPTRDVDGKANGGSEWYSYQEDAVETPINEKLSLITTYSS